MAKKLLATIGFTVFAILEIASIIIAIIYAFASFTAADGSTYYVDQNLKCESIHPSSEEYDLSVVNPQSSGYNMIANNLGNKAIQSIRDDGIEKSLGLHKCHVYFYQMGTVNSWYR